MQSAHPSFTRRREAERSPKPCGWLTTTAFVLALLAVLPSALLAEIAWDEGSASYGDLSDDPLQPTPIALLGGHTLVEGLVGGGFDGFDVLAFRIPAGVVLRSIFVRRYAGGDLIDLNMFRGMAGLSGSPLGATPFGPAQVDDVDLLDLMGIDSLVGPDAVSMVLVGGGPNLEYRLEFLSTFNVTFDESIAGDLPDDHPGRTVFLSRYRNQVLGALPTGDEDVLRLPSGASVRQLSLVDYVGDGPTSVQRLDETGSTVGTVEVIDEGDVANQLFTLFPLEDQWQLQLFGADDARYALDFRTDVGVVWDERFGGPLSNEASSPTPLPGPAFVGTRTLAGSVEGAADFVWLELPPDQELRVSLARLRDQRPGAASPGELVVYHGPVETPPFTVATLGADSVGETVLELPIVGPETVLIEIGANDGSPAATDYDYDLELQIGRPACRLYRSRDLPLDLPPSGSVGTTTSTITVPVGPVSEVGDVNVRDLRGSHGDIQDLTFSLTSPAGTTVFLMTEQFCADPDFYLEFDDESIHALPVCPATTGLAYRPLFPLAAFDGEAREGAWVLTIEDDFSGNSGVFDSWALEICRPAEAPLFADGFESGDTSRWGSAQP